HLDRSTGVVSTACREGDLGQWGRPGTGGGRVSERSRKGLRPVWASERAIRPMRPGNAGGGKGPHFWCACEGGKGRGLTMSLTTPSNIRELQIKLYRKAKNEPEYRFYLLYDKIYREDILSHAYRLVRANQGAPGVDGQSFEDIESTGLEKWLSRIREEL